jgi:uncharacterized protein YcbK (DUF882 family)
MNMDLVFKLDSMRKIIGCPLTVTSGYRTEKYNNKIGGARDSTHIKGLAVDLFCNDDKLRFMIIKYALWSLIVRIGIYPRHIHLDIDDSKSDRAVWYGTYPIRETL